MQDELRIIHMTMRGKEILLTALFASDLQKVSRSHTEEISQARGKLEMNSTKIEDRPTKI
jgi:hypothetical protein